MLKLHRLRRFARILVLTGEERRYLRAIRKSGLFDRTYYRGAYPGLNPIYLKYPEKHYIAYGEQLGYRPNPDFSPQAYLRYHPDVAEAGVPPFLHYVRVGHAEQRLTKELPEVVALPARGMPQVRFEHGRQTAPYAVAVHVYYPDLWPEFAARLRRLRIPFDLYVTLTYRGEETDALAEEIRADFPGAFVTPMPNRGRDILPFVTLLNAGAFDGYRAVCKFHTKKSPHRQDGDLWRQHLIEGILPETGLEEKLEAFIEAPEAGFWVADGQHYTGTQWWGSNVEATRHLLQRIEIPLDREALSFPAGSIYWVKPLVLGLLRSLQLRLEDFDIEEGQVDGTLAHAIERVLGYLTARAGQKVLQTSEARPGRGGGAREARLRQRLLPAPVPSRARERRLVGQGLHRMALGGEGALDVRGPSPADAARRSGLLRPARHRGDGRAGGDGPRGRDRRLLRLSLLVRRPPHPRGADRPADGAARDRLSLLSLLGQRELAAQLGRAVGHRAPRTELWRGLRGEARRRHRPLSARSALCPPRRPPSALRDLPSRGHARSAGQRGAAARGLAEGGDRRGRGSARCSSMSRAPIRCPRGSSTSGSRCRRTGW